MLIAHQDVLCIYDWLFVLIISLSIIPTERQVQQCTDENETRWKDDKVRFFLFEGKERLGALCHTDCITNFMK